MPTTWTLPEIPTATLPSEWTANVYRGGVLSARVWLPPTCLVGGQPPWFRLRGAPSALRWSGQFHRSAVSGSHYYNIKDVMLHYVRPRLHCGEAALTRIPYLNACSQPKVESSLCHHTPVLCCQPGLLLDRRDPRFMIGLDREDDHQQHNHDHLTLCPS
jgi:hypothetical protein